MPERFWKVRRNILLLPYSQVAIKNSYVTSELSCVACHLSKRPGDKRYAVLKIITENDHVC